MFSVMSFSFQPFQERNVRFESIMTNRFCDKFQVESIVSADVWEIEHIFKIKPPREGRVKSFNSRPELVKLFKSWIGLERKSEKREFR